MIRNNRRRYKCFVLIVSLSWVCILLMHAKLEDQNRYNDMFRGKFNSFLFKKKGETSESYKGLQTHSVINSTEADDDSKENELGLMEGKKRSERDVAEAMGVADQIEDGRLVETVEERNKRLHHEHGLDCDDDEDEEEDHVYKKVANEDAQGEEPKDDTLLQKEQKKSDLIKKDSPQENVKVGKVVEEVPERYGQSLREEVQKKIENEVKVNHNEIINEKQVKKQKEDLPVKKTEKRSLEGPGEMGRPVELKGLSEEEKKIQKEGWRQYQYDVFVSDKISLRRSLPDTRDPLCKEEGRYRSDLPSTSIIITFYDEAWSVLLRTIHSIIDRTPAHLIEEILLIDDFSSLAFLKEELDEYVSKIPKVRIIHNKKREGLMRSRIIGAKEAKSQLLTYIDSHCEATEGWLEPLLDVVQKNRTFVAVPIIDIISDKTFSVGTTGCNGGLAGGFDWRLVYKWESGIVPANRKRCENFKTPAMAGGLFTIDKAFFEKLGYYDDKLEVWGGENIELSLKLWMCGGGIQIVPCSHVAHVYRAESPYVKESQKQFGSYILKNYARVAKVWLEDHAPYYFQRAGHRPEEAGDVTKALQVKNRLQCKSFQWYLDNIYPQLFDIKSAIASGSVMNLDGRNICLDTMGETTGPLKTYRCHHTGGNQYWSLTKTGEIRQDKYCASYFKGRGLTLTMCSARSNYQKWRYQDGKIIHIEDNQCLTLEPKKNDPVLKDCTDQKSMKWKFQYINEKGMEEYNRIIGLQHKLNGPKE